MNFLVTYIMRNRTSAVLVAIASVILSLLLPPVSYLSGAIIGLVTLRHGSREGLLVMGIAALLIMLPALFSGGAGLVAVFAAVVWLPVWVLAVVLRQTVSLPVTILAAALLGVVCVMVIHGLLADPAQWWRAKLEMLQPVLAEAGWKAEDIEANLTTLSGAMTAMLAAAVMMTPLISLFIARWWQALLYNPGGWRDEFQQLRLPHQLVWVAAAVVVAAWFAGGFLQAIAADLLVIALLLYLLQGLSVAHALVRQRGLNVGWLVGLYVLMLLLPQTTMVVAGLGFTDVWLDYRSRINAID